MTWSRTYRAALRLLPSALQRKHGDAMTALFVRQLADARARGRLAGHGAGAAGVWDVVQRAAYERARVVRAARDTHPDATYGAVANAGASAMPAPDTRRIVRQLAISLARCFALITAVMLGVYAVKQVPPLVARGAPPESIALAILLAVPFTAAMTLPMATFVAVLRLFMRRDAAARFLLAPALAMALVVAALDLGLTDQIVPRTNAQLSAVTTGAAHGRNDREMSIAELRAAARRVRANGGEHGVASAAGYHVEVQKKLALAAACVVLALAGAAIGTRLPGRGAVLATGASVAVFGAYYVCIVAGETLADQLVVSPFVGMWSANLVLLAGALLAVWTMRGRFAPRDGDPRLAGR